MKAKIWKNYQPLHVQGDFYKEKKNDNITCQIFKYSWL
jgi:hypothetical protein